MKFVVVLLLTTAVSYCESAASRPGLHRKNARQPPVFSSKRGPVSFGDFVNPPGEGPNPDWNDLARRSIEEVILQAKRMVELDHKAHNVIFFMGDGMGASTLTSARVYMAQSRKIVGEDAILSWEKFPYTALSRTYGIDVLTSDSANTATAMMCAEKARETIICGNQHVVQANCSSLEGNHLKSILHHAIDNEMWTGVVTSTRITHASPSVNYAHSAHRDWESDANLPENVTCPDIASQLIDLDINKNIRVILGGGRYNMLPKGTPDPEYPNDTYSMGTRLDGRNLIQEWLDQKNASGLTKDQFAFVMDQEGFDAVDEDSIEYLMGLFEPGHKQYESERTDEPSLAEMVEKAINILKKGDNGYFLFVEGGRIDHAHHDNLAFKALNETVMLSDAVQRAIELTSEDDTLLVVTADHSHVFQIAGFPSRDSDILVWDSGWNSLGQKGDDGKLYTTLQYANGPGFYYHRTQNGSLETEIPRIDLAGREDEIGGLNFQYDAGIPIGSETHAGEDVPVFARGPMAHLFHGTQEQNYIAHVIKYALCIGENTDLCSDPPPAIGECPTVGSGSRVCPHYTLMFVLTCLLMIIKTIF